MKKLALIFAMLFLLGCNDELVHTPINSKDSFKTTTEKISKNIKIDGWDKPFLLYYFTSSCDICAAQVPILNEILQERNGKIKLIGVLGDTKGVDDDLKTIASKNITFPVVSNKKSVKFLAKAVGGIMATPVTVIFDKNGKQVKMLLGLYPKSTFESELKLLGE